MNKNEYEIYILSGLFNEEPRNIPGYLNSLKDEMFFPDNRRMFNVLMSGERDQVELARLTGWKHSAVLDLLMSKNQYLSESLIKEYKQLCLRGDAEKALLDNDWDKLTGIANQIQDTPQKDPMEMYKEYKEQFRQIANSGLLGVSTGIAPLDYATKGLIPGHIWVCGAYYGHGKTYFAINLMSKLLELKKRVLFISLEMPPEEIVQRFVALKGELNLLDTVRDVDMGTQFTRNEAERFVEVAVKEGNLLIDSDSRNINSVLSVILRENFKRHIDLVVIDYIQLMADQEKQYEAISQAVQKIQGLAKKTKTTVLLLSQVNNASQQMGDQRSVDGFKGAGDIGQVANVAIRIERDRDPITNEFGNRFGLRLTKVRHGMPTKLDMLIEFPGGKIREPKEGELQEPIKPMTKREARIAAVFSDS